jgi:hypothetical protein
VTQNLLKTCGTNIPDESWYKLMQQQGLTDGDGDGDEEGIINSDLDGDKSDGESDIIL